uniref:Disease resistance R13L4/SHOC-2-like LRR domain-containing protein n=1 Tax=Brassica oleracea TaxID=3712 RepID=A0A3P6C0J0_BRAOL|nr:unnamed protein product [Brassica oleracea]
MTGELPVPPPNIIYLSAWNNSFTGNIPLQVCDRSSLTVLDLSYNKLTGPIPQCLSNLKIVNLRKNNLEGSIPDEFYSGGLTQTLDVGYNRLTGKLPRSLLNCSFLSLPPSFFVNWKASAIKVDEDGRIYMGDYKHAYYVYEDTMDLQYKGLFMEQGKVLTSYNTIDFSGNKLEGHIPESIGLLKALIALNLSNNAFTGRIPLSLANVTELESLDLSRNHLSGTIPRELGSLSFLAYISVAHNQLKGTCFAPPEQQPEEEDEEEEEVLNWKAVVIGYGPGLLSGLLLAHVTASYKPKWYLKIVGLDKPKETLSKTFGNVSNISRVFELKRVINSMKQDGGELTKHMRKFGSLWSELESKGELTMAHQAEGMQANKAAYRGSGRKYEKYEGGCEHCKRTGHKKSECWILHPHGVNRDREAKAHLSAEANGAGSSGASSGAKVVNLSVASLSSPILSRSLATYEVPLSLQSSHCSQFQSSGMVSVGAYSPSPITETPRITSSSEQSSEYTEGELPRDISKEFPMVQSSEVPMKCSSEFSSGISEERSHRKIPRNESLRIFRGRSPSHSAKFEVFSLIICATIEPSTLLKFFTIFFKWNIYAHTDTSIYTAQDHQLIGSFPLINNLTKLSVLSLSQNLFTGAIPSSIFTMPSLFYLNVNDNHLTGPHEVPDSSTSSSLEFLNLGKNQFEGKILEPISKVINLKRLDLSFLNISYPIDLRLLSSLKSLLDLYLSGNSLLATSLSADSDIPPNLETLVMSYCDLNEKLDELRVEKLAKDHIEVCFVKNCICASFDLESKFFLLENSTPLLELDDLGDELDVDKLLLEIENPHAENYHENVNIVYYMIDGDRVDYFVKTLFEPVVDFGSSTIDVDDVVVGLVACLPRQIEAFTQFTNEFDTRSCNHSDYSNNGAWCDNSTGAVTKIHLTGCLSGTLKPNSSLFGFHQLRHLDLSNNNFISSTLPSKFGNLNRLEVLILSSNGLLGEVPSSISNLSQLSILKLSKNKLIGSFPLISNLTKLSVLSLSQNLFTGTIPSSIFTMPSLFYLNVNDNHLTGPHEVPDSSTSSSLEFLNLGKNQFEGKILEPISKLINLKRLDLSFLNISYPIDLRLLSSLKSLLDLYLSGNSLLATSLSADSDIPPNLETLVMSYTKQLAEFKYILKQNQRKSP